MTGPPDFQASAERALAAFGRDGGRARGRPADAGGLRIQHSKPRQIVLVGERDAPDTRQLLAALHARFFPNGIVLLVDAEVAPGLGPLLPSVADMTAIGGQATAYVCEDYACQLPTADVAEFGQLLQ